MYEEFGKCIGLWCFMNLVKKKFALKELRICYPFFIMWFKNNVEDVFH
jgi:hypothetical protein